jgi:hypothetical protein
VEDLLTCHAALLVYAEGQPHLSLRQTCTKYILEKLAVDPKMVFPDQISSEGILGHLHLSPEEFGKEGPSPFLGTGRFVHTKFSTQVLQKLAMMAYSGIMVLVEGPPSSGKTAFLEELASFFHQKLVRIPVTSEMEVTDLMWGIAPLIEGMGSPTCRKLNLLIGQLLHCKGIKTVELAKELGSEVDFVRKGRHSRAERALGGISVGVLSMKPQESSSLRFGAVVAGLPMTSVASVR